MIEGWWYLHTNGSLIYKRELGGTAADIRESDFAKALWPHDSTDRDGAWRILVEALAFGADRSRIMDLADKWGCTNADAQHYADYLNLVLRQDGSAWCVHGQGFQNLQDDDAGFGDTALEAFADFARTLGLQPSKMWGATFHDLVIERVQKKEEPS